MPGLNQMPVRTIDETRDINEMQRHPLITKVRKCIQHIAKPEAAYISGRYDVRETIICEMKGTADVVAYFHSTPLLPVKFVVAQVSQMDDGSEWLTTKSSHGSLRDAIYAAHLGG